jgi:uncharacterized spore protein YtfJ
MEPEYGALPRKGLIVGKVSDLVSNAGDTITVRRVFGEPIERNGVTLIPAAAVRGGAGGGDGESPDGSGMGGGFGVSARPVGAYQIKGDEVTWVPAADTTRVIVLAQVVAIIALLVIRSVMRTRRKRA